MRCTITDCVLGPDEHEASPSCHEGVEQGAPADLPPPPPPGTPNKGGRPSKLDPAVAEKVLEYLKRGNYIETAAAAAGVSKTTIYDWLRRGARQRAGAFRDFLTAVEKAQAEAEALDLGRLEKLANKGDFRAISWRLERRNARRWGPQIQITVQQALDEYLGYLQANLPADVYEKVLAVTMAWDGSVAPKVG